MRKLIYSMMVSLDGYIETSNRKIDWVIIDLPTNRRVKKAPSSMDGDSTRSWSSSGQPRT